MENLDLFECRKFRSVYLSAETEVEYTGDPVTSPEQAAELFRGYYGKTIQTVEKIYALYLSHWKKPLAISQISVGCISAAVCDIRVIAKIAIDTLASSVILCHNHPSGNPEESAADIKLSDNVNKTLKLFGCELVDHIILTESSYTSLNGKF